MPKLEGPLQLSAVFKPKIWGREDLAPLFPRPHLHARHADSAASASPATSGDRKLIGEVWITDDESRFLNGALAGLTLREASKEYGTELHGTTWTDSRFPILAKYIYTGDWLSVQVHPDDDYARVHDPGNRGKCEMWYAVRAYRGAKILLGTKHGVTKEELKQACETGSSRGLLKGFRPGEGEAIFVPPGTVHALGPGLVLFEVEENSDLTYRLDDFGRVGLEGRPRPLHWNKAWDAIRVELPAHRNLPRIALREPFGARRPVLASRFFALEELTLRQAVKWHGEPDRVEVFSFLEGQGRVETAGGWMGYRTGDTWLIPPRAQPYRLVPRGKTRLFKFYVPDLAGLRRELERRRVPSAKVSGVIFD